ncbi:MAG TPA: sulfur oxidation c-type cytochrome SoxX [Burkholderiales bacterium]|nr:sulfur oxidation c-type cytochrome SoxX [Burkholderiales bacterium]
MVAALLITTTPFAAGDPARGRALVADRFAGMCLLCHRAPIPEERFQGDLAPDLAGVGARLSPEEIRARIADPRRANPDTFMPAYFSTQDLVRVAPAYRGKTLFTEQQLEDVVAYLATLK